MGGFLSLMGPAYLQSQLPFEESDGADASAPAVVEQAVVIVASKDPSLPSRQDSCVALPHIDAASDYAVVDGESAKRKRKNTYIRSARAPRTSDYPALSERKFLYPAMAARVQKVLERKRSGGHIQYCISYIVYCILYFVYCISYNVFRISYFV